MSDELTVVDLREQAKSKGITGFSTLTKDELLTALDLGDATSPATADRPADASQRTAELPEAPGRKPLVEQAAQAAKRDQKIAADARRDSVLDEQGA